MPAAVLVAVPLSLVRSQQLITLDRLTHSHALVSNILDSTTGTAILGTDREGRIEFFNLGAGDPVMASLMEASISAMGMLGL